MHLLERPGRAPAGGWVLRKDVSELLASNALWLLLLVVGFLVGHAFLTATSTYAEMSGAGGGPMMLAQGLSPLDGIVVPTFGAYDLAATFLLPFVVIRLVATERQTGAIKLVLQTRTSHASLMLSKVTVLLGCWLVAMIPGVIALAMWRAAGGHLSASEVACVLVGHLVLAAIAVGVSAAASGVARSSASAAIVALTFTLGTWAIDFVGAVQGGWVQEVSRYTPSAVVRTFEHGELRLATIVIAAIVVAAGLGLATVALDLGSTRRQQMLRSTVLLGTAAVVALGASRLRGSWDVSEDRRSSFAPADERTLAAIRDPLTIEIHLAREDPRRVDFERNVLAKLQRSMRVNVVDAGSTGTGMLSRSSEYGEMIYALRGNRDTTRSVAEPIVLETIYHVARMTPPGPPANSAAYRGYPLARAPGGIAIVFFVLWPAMVIAGWMFGGRKVSWR